MSRKATTSIESAYVLHESFFFDINTYYVGRKLLIRFKYLDCTNKYNNWANIKKSEVQDRSFKTTLTGMRLSSLAGILYYGTFKATLNDKLIS